MSNQTTFIMLENFIQPDMEAVAAAIRARHPDTTASVPSVPIAAGGRSPIIVCAGKVAIVMALPVPLPHDDGVIKRAATTWPQAREAYGDHRAHLIVSMQANEQKSLEEARVMTALIGGIVTAVPGCIGVAWRNEVLLPANIWLQMSQAAFAPYPDFPIMLWVAIHPFRYDSGVGAVTTGLSSQIGREIEFEGGSLSLPDVIDKVSGLAAYLIEHGMVINDGDSVGASERERLKASYVTSKRFSGWPVLLVTSAAGDSALN